MKTDQIMEYVCDNLCRYPAEYKDPDDLWAEQCDHCRLMELLEDENDDWQSFLKEKLLGIDAIIASGSRAKIVASTG